MRSFIDVPSRIRSIVPVEDEEVLDPAFEIDADRIGG
jgi:hypothetical protein